MQPLMLSGHRVVLVSGKNRRSCFKTYSYVESSSAEECYRRSGKSYVYDAILKSFQLHAYYSQSFWMPSTSGDRVSGMCGMGLVSREDETFHSPWNGMVPKSARRIFVSASFAFVLSKSTLIATATLLMQWLVPSNLSAIM